MLRIGLTGGIGSGKTTVARIFEVLGVPVYYADDAAKKMMTENESIRQQIIYHFGDESYSGSQLNRSYLAKAVFSNPEKTELINSIIHPATIADAAAWMEKQTYPYAIKEAALIFEANAEKHLDLVIGVRAPLQMRIRRTMQRNGVDETAVISRMNKQWDDEKKMNRCDIIIDNDEKELLIPQVIEVHQKLLSNIERVHN